MTKTPTKTLADLFEHALGDIYYAEKKIHKTLPKLIKAAQDPRLKEGLTKHRDETQAHVTKLESVFKMLGKKAKAEKCDAIDGILDESAGLLDDFGGTPAGDAAIIFSSQAVEHYEITRYGSMHAFALALGHKDAAAVLDSILEQEKQADSDLSALAESRVNHAAESGRV